MSLPAPAIVWFRQDLRLADNPALLAAARSGSALIPLYILNDGTGLRPPGGASNWWLDKSLARLGADLEEGGAYLVLRRGEACEVLVDLIRETGARQVFWNRLYDAPSIARDKAIKSRLAASGVAGRSFNANLLSEPWSICSATGGPYRVFTAYWRALNAGLTDTAPRPCPDRLIAHGPKPRTDRLAAWDLHPQNPDWSRGFTEWVPGEKGARDRLDAFLEQAIDGYDERRNLPAESATSKLSPHLHFGEIGPRQIWAALDVRACSGAATGRSIGSFRRELAWREFNHHLLFHNPAITQRNYNTVFDDFPWRDDPEGLRAWRRGRTGFPIVDAGMRELWGTGWMHNRVRMIVASFLTKDLMIDWRAGEAWFWDTLVDADLANNVASWQWVAGSGSDAAPYFRVFNPTLQGRKFDPTGRYVRRWLPELAGLPSDAIHQPSESSAEVRAAAGVELGAVYPTPIVDHAFARGRALDAYERLRR